MLWMHVQHEPRACVLSMCKNTSRRHHPHPHHCYQVPAVVFITDKLPKTATGKIQRRMMVEHFVKNKGGQVSRAPTAAPPLGNELAAAPTAGAEGLMPRPRARL